MKIRKTATIIFIIFLFSSCAKEWLDKKSDKSLVVPSSLNDFQALLDNFSVMNTARVPNLGEISSDDYNVPIERWETLPPWQRNAHTWNDRIFENRDGEENWNNPYQQIYYANLVLEGLNNIEIDEQNMITYHNLKGSALFHRAFAYFHLSQIFCDAYDQNTAVHKLGLPLRKSTDLEVALERSNLDDTYKFLLNDLLQAKDLLPNKAIQPFSPSKASTLALLAKTYLVIRDYENAFLYADSCIQLHPDLIDFNGIDLTANYPFSRFNTEAIFHVTMQVAPIITATRVNISPDLTSLYSSNDLRKEAFYRTVGENTIFKGSYNGSSTLFGGISANEIYLIKSEALSRLGQTATSVSVLNHLLKHRYSDFVPMEITDNNELLKRIILERRKELPFRGIRWSDLRRLNLEKEHETILMRVVDGESFSIVPNSNRYTLPIPDIVVQLSNGIIQNTRN